MSIKVMYISNEEDVNLAEEYLSAVKSQGRNLDNLKKTTLILDFRRVSGSTKVIETKAYKLQKVAMNIQLCKIETSGKVWIEIRSESDYIVFFQEFVVNGEIKSEYEKSNFVFYVNLEGKGKTQSVDEQILYYYYLIANRYRAVGFDVQVVLQKENVQGEEDTKWLDDNYYRISAYAGIQKLCYGLNIKVRRGRMRQEFQSTSVGNVGKILPVITIDAESLHQLTRPITEKLWKQIQTHNKNKTNNVKEVLISLCQRYLFKKLDMFTEVYNIRNKTFLSPDFFTAIEGIPMLALLIFAEVDYYSRMEMVAEYQNLRGKKHIGVKDLLDDYQEHQDYKSYCIHRNMVKEGTNIKSLLTRLPDSDSDRGFVDICNDMDECENCKSRYEEELYKTYGLHTHIVTEIYEAVAIAEGLLQLLDNVVTHAELGIMSMRIHCRDDKSVLKERYLSYFLRRKHRPQAKYFLEVRISDLSGSDIADKFRSNYIEFGNELKEEHKLIFDSFSLDSFFNPVEHEQQLWDLFYNNSQNVVNHYGLQIFESIIRAKDGYFTVVSGEEIYRSEKSMSKQETTSLVYPGTSYTILMPLDNKIAEDKNIYDSMFAYDVCNYLRNDRQLEKHVPNLEGMGVPGTSVEERRNFYEDVCEKVRQDAQTEGILVIDMDKVSYLEGTVKGIMLYLFREREKDASKDIHIAFVNCKTYQIVEIVRLVSLSYDKAGRNSKMKNVQIYIRGKNIGEEIIFFGNTLTEVGNNIMKLACMRGTLFDNSQAVYTLLKRK